METVGQAVTRLVSEGKIVELAQTATAPPGVPVLTLDELLARFDPRPWWKNWVVWTVVGTGVVGATGAYVALRKGTK